MSSEPTIVTARRKYPAAYYMHMTFLIMASVVIAFSVWMKVVGSNLVYLPGIEVPLPESCTAKIFMGFECPACGMTRAFISISDGQFSNAWTFNPASFVVYLFVAIQIPWQSFQMWLIHRGNRAVESSWIYVLPILTILSMFLQWIARLCH